METEARKLDSQARYGGPKPTLPGMASTFVSFYRVFVPVGQTYLPGGANLCRDLDFCLGHVRRDGALVGCCLITVYGFLLRKSLLPGEAGRYD